MYLHSEPSLVPLSVEQDSFLQRATVHTSPISTLRGPIYCARYFRKGLRKSGVVPPELSRGKSAHSQSRWEASAVHSVVNSSHTRSTTCGLASCRGTKSGSTS